MSQQKEEIFYRSKLKTRFSVEGKLYELPYEYRIERLPGGGWLYDAFRPHVTPLDFAIARAVDSMDGCGRPLKRKKA